MNRILEDELTEKARAAGYTLYRHNRRDTRFTLVRVSDGIQAHFYEIEDVQSFLAGEPLKKGRVWEWET
jgi:hypothetical protein